MCCLARLAWVQLRTFRKEILALLVAAAALSSPLSSVGRDLVALVLMPPLSPLLLLLEEEAIVDIDSV
jgi:hypothetical protein